MEFNFSAARVVSLPKAVVRFQKWSGPPVADSYGGKVALDYLGEPLFAELVILRLFQAAGWQGVWIDTFRRRTRISLTEDSLVPKELQVLLDHVVARAGTRDGCFDVLAWRDKAIAFAEAKRSGRDRIRPSQVHWRSSALDVGVPLDSLLVVEWSLERS